MKIDVALVVFILCVCLETQGLRIPPFRLDPLPPIFPDPMIPMEAQIFPNPEDEHDQMHGGYGGYGGYGPYRPDPGPFRPDPEPRPRPRPRPSCMDKNDALFCENALMDDKCGRRKYQKRCAKTCGVCEDEGDCEDTSFNCDMARYHHEFYCARSWFASGCKKTCNLCPTVTTSTPGPKPEPAECIDTSTNCRLANIYRCSMFWFKTGCRKSCEVCKPTATSTIPTTTSTTPPTTTTSTEGIPTEEPCADKRDDCNTFLDWYCGVPFILEECQRFCGECEDLEETTALHTIYEPSTMAETTLPLTTEGYIHHANETTADTEPPTTPTTGTMTTEPEIPPEGSGIEPPCVDTDPKNCNTWESLGLCYNPQYEENMAKLCRLSCQLC